MAHFFTRRKAVYDAYRQVFNQLPIADLRRGDARFVAGIEAKTNAELTRRVAALAQAEAAARAQREAVEAAALIEAARIDRLVDEVLAEIAEEERKVEVARRAEAKLAEDRKALEALLSPPEGIEFKARPGEHGIITGHAFDGVVLNPDSKTFRARLDATPAAEVLPDGSVRLIETQGVGIRPRLTEEVLAQAFDDAKLQRDEAVYIYGVAASDVRVSEVREVNSDMRRGRRGVQLYRVDVPPMTPSALGAYLRDILAHKWDLNYPRWLGFFLIRRVGSAAELKGALPPMRAGDENCVVRAVFSALPADSKGALAALRSELNERFGATGVHGDEALRHISSRIRAVTGGGRGIKTSIYAVDVAGAPLWGEQKNKHHKQIRLVYHDGHCFTADVLRRPEFLRTKDMWAATAADFIEQEAARRAGAGLEPTWFQLIGEGCGEFGAVAVIAGDGTLWRQPGHTRQLLDSWQNWSGWRAERMSRSAESADALDEEERRRFDLDCGKLTSEQSRLFRAMLAAGGIAPLATYRDEWRRACVEFSPWQSTTTSEHVQLDMVAAFASYGSPASAAKPYYDRYGVPTETMRCVSVSGPPSRAVLATRGIAEIVSLTLRPGLHAYFTSITRHVLGRGWLATPLLAWLHEAGLVVECTVGQLVYSIGGATLPLPARASRLDAVCLVGRLTPTKTYTSVFCRHEAEARYVESVLAEKKTAEGDSRFGGRNGNIVRVRDLHAPPDYVHIRAFIVGAYAQINLLSQILRFDPEDVARVQTDAIYVPRSALHLADRMLPGGADTRDSATWGLWRPKAEDEGVRIAHGAWDYGLSAARDVALAQPTFNADPICFSPVSLLEGAAGSGKSKRAVEAVASRDSLILVPTHALRFEYMRRGVGLMSAPSALGAVATLHAFFRQNGDGKAFDPDRMHNQSRPSWVVIDEAYVYPWAFLAPRLAWLTAKKIPVIMCGDPHQLLPREGKTDVAAVRRLSAHTETLDTDLRAARCPRLQALKSAMWGKPDAAQLTAATAVLPPAIDQVAAVLRWRPGDVILAGRRDTVARLGAAVMRQHLALAPDVPMPVRYIGETGVVPVPGGPPAKTYRGAIIDVPAGTPLPAGWQPAAVMTITRSQGSTIHAPARIYAVGLATASEWLANAAYVALSRAEELSQLVLVA